MNKECAKSVLRIFSYAIAIGDIEWINYARKDYTIVDNNISLNKYVYFL